MTTKNDNPLEELKSKLHRITFADKMVDMRKSIPFDVLLKKARKAHAVYNYDNLDSIRSSNS